MYKPKNIFKKVLSTTCAISLLCGSTHVLAAGYEVTLTPSIDYIDGFHDRLAWDEEVITEPTYFFPTPFYKGISIVHHNMQVCEGGMSGSSLSSNAVDIYGNPAYLGEYDRIGVTNTVIDSPEWLEERVSWLGEGYLYDFDTFLGVDPNGYIIVLKDNKLGLIDTLGNVIAPCEYDDLFSESFKEKYGFDLYNMFDYDEYEGKYFPAYFDPYVSYLEGVHSDDELPLFGNLAVVAESEEDDSKVGIVDKDDNIIVPFIFDMITPCYDDICWVLKDGKWGIIKVNKNSISVSLNGTLLTFDQAPLVINGRTLAPVRAIFESLGATVEWNNDTREIISTKGNDTIIMKIDDFTMYKNGNPIFLDSAPQIVGERTLVPVRAIAEAFNCTVAWDNNTQTVIIND